MNKIESLYLHGLRNNEHFQFMTDFDVLVTNIQPAELGIEGLYPTFKTALQTEDATMRTELGSARSKTIEELDSMRDRTYKAMVVRTNATLLSPIEAEAESARLVKRIFDLYGDVRALSYNEESAAISNLISDLLLPVNAAHLGQMGMTHWANELKNQNDQFQSEFNRRNTELAGRESGDVRGIRIEIDPIYNQMIEKINASIILEVAKPVVSRFVDELNEKIKYYQTTLAARSGRSKKGEKPVENN
jgi:hypothetical protein